jgi:hypothetical protein
MKNKCIFCSSVGPFSKEEHIIPESLGGNEILPQGFVCDQCNSYFGSKVEHEALSLAPLILGRIFMSVKSKKKRHARSQRINFGKNCEGTAFQAEGSDETDIIVRVSKEIYDDLKSNKIDTFYIPIEGMASLTRLLLKMALEVMVTSKKSKGVEVYDTFFDSARHAARCPTKLTSWKIASTVLPMGSEWTFGKDNKGTYARQTQYQYSLGRLANHSVFNFQYWILVFIIPLTDSARAGDFEFGVDLLNKSNPLMQPLTISTVNLA